MTRPTTDSDGVKRSEDEPDRAHQGDSGSSEASDRAQVTHVLECGIDYSRLTGWLESQSESHLALGIGTAGAANLRRYFWHRCAIDLEPLEPRYGGHPFTLPRNRVTFYGDAADVEAFMHRFMLQFLSAGG